MLILGNAATGSWCLFIRLTDRQARPSAALLSPCRIRTDHSDGSTWFRDNDCGGLANAGLIEGGGRPPREQVDGAPESRMMFPPHAATAPREAMR